MNINDLKIKQDGYDTPRIAIMTLEIRTINQVAKNIPEDRFQI